MAKKPEKKADKKPDAKTDGDPSEAAPKAAGGLIGLLILGAASLGSSFGLVYLLTPLPATASEACVAGEQTTAAIEPTAKADQAYVQMQEILITVGSAPATRYLKMNVSVITEGGNTEAVKAAEPPEKPITIADRILVFQEGRIIADGNHETLRESNEIYQSMIGSQFLGAGA